MREWKNVVFAVVCIAAGALMSSYFGADLTAQQQVELLTRAPMEQVNEAQKAWEIYHGTYLAPQNSNDARFYVVRHNRLTGDTHYIACEDRDGCTQLKLEIQY